ncbi:hypothetical protein CRUP_037792 [Coryphaenoides rupestris]|nr:hypothetical protein CRUP_037792 [Coryphaenoides rupestris]
MNQNNVFGSSQGGTFQAPTNKPPGLFQSFGQQSTGQSQPQPQNMNFFQTSTFGQPSSLNQTPSTMFGQTLAFGQPSVFRLHLSDSQLLDRVVQVLAPVPRLLLGRQVARAKLGLAKHLRRLHLVRLQLLHNNNSNNPPRFGLTSATGSTNTLVSTQPAGFGQSAFGQPSTAVTASTVQNVTQQAKGFGSTGFSFKPADEVLFKPIYSASPEPTNTQATATGQMQTFGAMNS